jgi:hypothetical protein
MTAWRQVIELSISDEDVAKLMAIARSRTVPASLVERARIGYVHDQSAIYAFRVCELVGPSEIADVAAIRCDDHQMVWKKLHHARYVADLDTDLPGTRGRRQSG